MIKQVAQFSQQYLLRWQDKALFILQILFILFTGSFICTKDLKKYHQGYIHQHIHYKRFIQGFILFAKQFYKIWCDTINEQIHGRKWKKDQWNLTYLHALIPISEINEMFLNSSLQIKQQFIIPEVRWDNYLKLAIQPIADRFFFGLIKIIPCHDAVQQRYLQNTQWIITNQLYGASTLQLCESTIDKLSGEYTEFQNTILLQLAMPRIFNKMKLLNVYQKTINGKIIKENLCKYKFIHDGYSLNNGRTIELFTLTNVSIPFMGQTSSNCDVIGAFDIEKEDRTKLFKALQIYGIQLLILGTLGSFHPITNRPIHFQISRPADTHATQFSIGSPSFSGGNGHLYTTHPKSEVYKINHVCPINRTALHVNHNWRSSINHYWHKIQAYENTHFANEDIDKDNIWIKCGQFDKLKAKLREYTNEYCYMRSPWLIAACAYDFGIDGLHGEMNITAIVCKYIFF